MGEVENELDEPRRIWRDALPRDPAWHVHQTRTNAICLYTRERPRKEAENELRDEPRRIW